MFWTVAYRSEYAPSARLSLGLRVLRTRSLAVRRSTEGWHATTTQVSDLPDQP